VKYADVLISPALHGELGVLDELLLFCLPLVVVLVVLALTAQRSRRKQERMRSQTKAEGYGDTQSTEKTQP
jgi:cytochrome c-type biogenesis protein CcmH/NrfF